MIASVSQVAAQDTTTSAWARVATASSGPAQAYGRPQAGCLAGAIALKPAPDTLRLMRPQRHRHFGHPKLIALVGHLARTVNQEFGAVLLVGDLSQPRGGPMPYGHRSHQSGLDADVRYEVLSSPGLATPKSTRSMLHAKHSVSPARWTPLQTSLLRSAALADDTDRIFVNAAIKRHLCRHLGEKSDANWLRKIRPWWGHDRHFHVRLRCPADSMKCEAQRPIPAGRGCDESLDWWFQERKQQKSTAPEKRPRVVLPQVCDQVIAATPKLPAKLPSAK